MFRPGPRKAGEYTSPAALSAVHVRCHNQHVQNFAGSIDQITPDAAVIIILNEPSEPSVAHAADIHAGQRTSVPYTRQGVFSS